MHLSNEQVFFYLVCHIQGFPGGSDSKESVCCVQDLGSIPELERSPGGGYGNPLQYSCLENPLGQRSLGHLQFTVSQRVDLANTFTCRFLNLEKKKTCFLKSAL